MNRYLRRHASWTWFFSLALGLLWSCAGPRSDEGSKADFLAPAAEDQPVRIVASAEVDCGIYSVVFADDELINAVELEIYDWSRGFICCSILQRPELMPSLRALEEVEQDLAGRFTALSDAQCAERLCPHRASWYVLLHRGLVVEQVPSPVGSIAVASTDDPKLLADVRSWVDDLRRELDAQAPPHAHDAQGALGGGEKTAAVPPDSREKPSLGLWSLVLRDCQVCRLYLDQPEMMTAARLDIYEIAQGACIVYTVKDPKNLERFWAFGERTQRKIDAIGKLPAAAARKRLGSLCRRFYDLKRDGAVAEWWPTATGTIGMVTADDPSLVTEIHDFARTVRAVYRMVDR